MTLTKEGYKKRLIDDKIEVYLKLFGAISIEGPKWCGKTWTSLNHANSSVNVSKTEYYNLASINPKNVINDNYPELIDEWQLIDGMWDTIKNECDEDNKKGKFILSGSTIPTDKIKERMFHSGAGRIARLKMYPMSLYESLDSDGKVSIMDMYEDNVKIGFDRDISIDTIIELIIRGGWPENIGVENKYIDILPKKYLESIITSDDINRDDRKRSTIKMEMLLKSLARNESTIVGIDTLVKDIGQNEISNEKIESRQTLADYLDVLNDIYLTNNQDAFSINYRSSDRIGKSVKRHLVDPSLACALLNLNEDKLKTDLNTLGFLFEGLVERDLCIYMNYLEGKLFHFRDNLSGDEVDAILEFKDGEYAAVEIKLSENGINDAKKNLLKFYDKVEKKKPKFMCIIVGCLPSIMKDEETGIYIIPITSLKP